MCYTECVKMSAFTAFRYVELHPARLLYDRGACCCLTYSAVRVAEALSLKPEKRGPIGYILVFGNWSEAKEKLVSSQRAGSERLCLQLETRIDCWIAFV